MIEKQQQQRTNKNSLSIDFLLCGELAAFIVTFNVAGHLVLLMLAVCQVAFQCAFTEEFNCIKKNELK